MARPGSPGSSLESGFGGRSIANDGFPAETAESIVEAGEVDSAAFGKLFIANPDLPERIRRKAVLNRYDPSTFYVPGPKGYTDYPSL